jgi:hypothetical protein
MLDTGSWMLDERMNLFFVYPASSIQHRFASSREIFPESTRRLEAELR